MTYKTISVKTDHVVDLFQAIEDAYDNKPSLFDNISEDDLIVAFFPCIYFCAMSQVAMYWTYVNYRNKTTKESTDLILERSANREKFFRLAVKMLAVAKIRGIRLVMENPWSEQTFLKSNFVMSPQVVDMNRMKRGDFFKKPTAFWFLNCEPTRGYTVQKTPKSKRKIILKSKQGDTAGLCSEERSMISPDYVRNFICDNILGITQQTEQLTLF